MIDPISVILIDDDPHIQTLVEHYLKDLNVNLTLAKDGYEALECLAKTSFELIILDYSMPYFNGLQVLKKIKLNYKNKNTPVIVLTYANEKEDVLSFFEQGISDYMIKPPTKTDLLARVSKILLKDLVPQ